MSENYADEGYTNRGTMERDVNTPISLNTALEDAMMQAEKLAQMINELSIKASDLMLSEDSEVSIKADMADKIAVAPRFASPTAERAYQIATQLRHNQSRLMRIIDRLDA